MNLGKNYLKLLLNFEKEKESILKKVKKMNPKNGIEIFNKYYIFLNQEMDLNIYKQKLEDAIKENITKACWDTIKSDMLKIPPDYTKVIELLEKQVLCLKVVHQKTRPYTGNR